MKKKILLRIIAVVKNLSKNNLACYGKKNENIDQGNNGIFLSLVEIIEEFNTIMQEHIPAYLTW